MLFESKKNDIKKLLEQIYKAHAIWSWDSERLELLLNGALNNTVINPKAFYLKNCFHCNVEHEPTDWVFNNDNPEALCRNRVCVLISHSNLPLKKTDAKFKKASSFFIKIKLLSNNTFHVLDSPILFNKNDILQLPEFKFIKKNEINVRSKYLDYFTLNSETKKYTKSKLSEQQTQSLHSFDILKSNIEGRTKSKGEVFYMFFDISKLV